MNIQRILLAAGLVTGILSFSSCKDEMLEEITALEFNRALSPTELDARVVNKTEAKLNWRAVNNADSYSVEFYENADFSGTPSKTINNILFEQLPYTVTGLSGETQYWVRVKAVGEGVEDSKWVSATITTDAEQIFQDVDPNTLTATSVTLKWPAGQAATSITLSPGNITRAVTAAEVAAGQATITGLTGETTYTVKLMNGAKVRGTKVFTTLIDLGGATAVYPTDDLAALIAAAAGGETFALFPGTYNINADVTVSKSISIKGVKPAQKPVINGMILRIKANAGLSLKDLVLNGTGSLNGNQTIIYDEALNTAYGALSVQDSEIRNYVKGLMYVNVKALIESVTFSGNIISAIDAVGGDFIDFRNGMAKTFLFENNTVYNSALARDVFRMDAGGSTNFPGQLSTITIRNNTFNNVGAATASRYLYIRLASHQIHFTKNIIANTNGYYTNQASTTITTMANNNYYNAPNFTASTTANAKNDTGVHTLLNPGFVDAAAGNFTLTNDDLKFNGIGDPRWRQ